MYQKIIKLCKVKLVRTNSGSTAAATMRSHFCTLSESLYILSSAEEQSKDKQEGKQTRWGWTHQHTRWGEEGGEIEREREREWGRERRSELWVRGPGGAKASWASQESKLVCLRWAYWACHLLGYGWSEEWQTNQEGERKVSHFRVWKCLLSKITCKDILD